ncbi:4-hydroxy-tetrahydrodipicolinate synthase [Thermincola potens]|uniref:4-hydroxy-tetrahydrodipicolinate synthase n=1 Tax=Thermincola potens (strain JR) TaxID=635013 RepID=D5XF37_THEPJ|nr:dihydrodipicolinate synthase [Thermincola potens JR]
METFGRVMTAMITPFDKDLAVNFGEVRKIARYLADNGSDGIVVAGTTGESPTLTKEEKLRLFEVVMEEVGDRVTVIAGTGSNVTADSVKLTKEAESIGVHGVMLVTPYYNKPPQDYLYNHFKTIAANTSLPVMLYNVPGRTGCNLLPDTAAKLAKIDNIVALKEASGSLDQVGEIRRKTPDNFMIYSGDDGLTLPLLAVGCCGVVSVAAHVVGKEMNEMVAALQRGDVEKAKSIHLDLLPVFRAMFITTSPIPVKAAMNMLGFAAGELRPPLGPAGPAESEVIRKTLLQKGILK